MVTRRGFLRWGALGAGLLLEGRVRAAQRGLDQFMTPAPPCKDETLTPATGQVADQYRPNAPARTSLVDAGAPGTRLVLTGYVVGLRCGRIRNAQLDFWHADAKGRIDPASFAFRGRQRTDADGRYRLDTIVPGGSGGRAPYIGVRLQPPSGPPLATKLFLPDHPANAADPTFNPVLVMKKGAGGAFAFDFVLDL